MVFSERKWIVDGRIHFDSGRNPFLIEPIHRVFSRKRMGRCPGCTLVRPLFSPDQPLPSLRLPYLLGHTHDPL